MPTGKLSLLQLNYSLVITGPITTLQTPAPAGLWTGLRSLSTTWPSAHSEGALAVLTGGPGDVQPDLRVHPPPPSAQALQAIPQGHITPIIDKEWRLSQPLRVARLQGKLMAAQGLPRGPTGQSPPSPTGLGEAAALRRQQENETHSEWPLSHHLCSWFPPPTLSCTGRCTCMQIPQRVQRREGPADQGAGEEGRGQGGTGPHPRRDKQDHGRRGFEPHSEWGAPWLRDRTSRLWACHGPGHSSHCLNLKLLPIQSLSCKVSLET